MKIEKIIIENLASLEGQQVVDFTAEPLRSASLFAITGDTGAGKSTILDAICLALYGRAPRFEGVERIGKENLVQGPDGELSIEAHDVRNLLRRGKKEGACSLVFVTQDGSRYEATWTVRRNRNNRYDPAERTLRQLSPFSKEFDPQAVKANVVTDIIGLDYEQFSRTVLLAQNSFANFLRARRDEKSSLLEKITGTEIYATISRHIFEMAKEARAQVTELELQMESILRDHLDEQELSERRTRLMHLRNLIADAEKQRDEAVRAIAWYDDYVAAVENVMNCEQQKDTADKQRAARRADEILLERYDSVLPIQPLFIDIGTHRRDIESMAVQLETKRREIAEKLQQIAMAEDRLKQAKNQSEIAETAYASRRTDIDFGNRLMGEIAMLEKNIDRREGEIAAAKRSLETHQRECAAKEDEMRQLQQRIADNRVTKQKLGIHQQMFENFDLVKDKLLTLDEETKRNAGEHVQLEENMQRLRSMSAAMERLETELHDNQVELTRQKNELMVHRQAIAGTDGASLHKRSADLRSRILLLEQAQLLWKKLSAGYENIAERTSRYQRDTTEIGQLKEDVQQLTIEIKVLQEESEHRNRAYTLSHSEHIESLRKQLKEGSACPVCGATHHPYHTETERELGELIHNLEHDYNEAAQRLENRRTQLRQQEQKLWSLVSQHEADEKYIEERRREQAEAEEEWFAKYAQLDTSFSDCSSSVVSHVRMVTIETLMGTARNEQEELSRKIDELNYHQNLIAQFGEQVAQLEETVKSKNEQLSNVRMEYHAINSRVEERTANIERSDRSVAMLYQELDRLVTLSGWFAEWKRSADGFRNRLIMLQQQWLSVCNRLEADQDTLVLTENELRNARQTVVEAARHIEEDEAQCQHELTILNDKREAYRRLFGEKTPQQMAEELQARISQAQKAETEASEQLLALQHAHSLLVGAQHNLESERERKQRSLVEDSTKMDNWIHQFNADHSPLQWSELEAFFDGSTDWLKLRAELNGLREQQSRAATLLQVARQTLQTLQASPNRPAEEHQYEALSNSTAATGIHISRDTLIAQRDQVMSKLESYNTELLQVAAILHSHDESERRIAAMKTNYDTRKANSDYWSQLSDVFGSADGRRFRELAQGYTFSSLVEQANHQLRMLSPRYRLRTMPGTLTLEIIDRDMFDQRRYVTSLSGGETFVVSLALALGLANLSAGSLSIGSLFIDEGFGNLDHESLDLVMTALSNLENIQGRKVGVVSHTEQIRSQISPQIHLHKLPTGGRSLIKVE